MLSKINIMRWNKRIGRVCTFDVKKRRFRGQNCGEDTTDLDKFDWENPSSDCMTRFVSGNGKLCRWHCFRHFYMHTSGNQNPILCPTNFMLRPILSAIIYLKLHGYFVLILRRHQCLDVFYATGDNFYLKSAGLLSNFNEC